MLGVRRSKDKSANHHAYHRYLLSRRNFVVVFLRRARLGGIKKTLRGQSGISVEDEDRNQNDDAEKNCLAAKGIRQQSKRLMPLTS